MAKEYEVHPGQVTDRKRTVQERLAHVFDRDAAGRVAGDFEREREELHSKIGALTIQVDFLEKNPNSLACEGARHAGRRKSP